MRRRARAEEACRRLLGRVRRRRCSRTDATVNELLDRHLALLPRGEHTRESYEYTAARHIRPFVGQLRLLAVTAERLDELYVEVLRCREHCTKPTSAPAASSCVGYHSPPRRWGVAVPSRPARPRARIRRSPPSCVPRSLDGFLPTGATLPTVKRLAALHHVAATARGAVLAVC